MNYYYDDDLDVHVRHGGYLPHQPVHYVESRPRPQAHYAVPAASAYLVPEQHTTVVARSRSRDRSRERPRPGPSNPVIINNNVYHDHSSDDDDFNEGRRQHSQLIHRHYYRHNSDSRSGSRSRSRSHSRSSAYKTRQEWEAEQTRRELEQMCIAHSREIEGKRMAQQCRDDAELQRAKRELDEIKGREARAEEEKRIRKDIDMKRLKEDEEVSREKQRQEKLAAEAVERYKQQEAERIAKEKKQKEENEKEYKRRLQENLIKSGLHEKAISAIVNEEKVPEALPEPQGRPTYTRMARRHLSVETLRAFRIDYDIDSVSLDATVISWRQHHLIPLAGPRVRADQAMGSRMGTRSVLEEYQVHS